jgi:two-component system, LytTR family, response regulator LytT
MLGSLLLSKCELAIAITIPFLSLVFSSFPKMALNCIILSPDPHHTPRIAAFLEASRFFAVKGRFSEVAQALRTWPTLGANYVLVDLSLAPELLFSLREVPLAEKVRIIVFGPEESYYLENASSNPNLFLEKPSFPESQLSGANAFAGGLIDPKKIEIPSEMAEVFALAKQETKPVWVLLKPGHWRYETIDEAADLLYVRTEMGVKRVRLGDLLAVEAQRDYLLLHTAQESFRLLKSLRKMESRLDPKVHLRVHRSFIVHVPSIHTIDENNLWLDGLSTAIPIGPSFRKDLLGRLEII